MTNAPQSPVDWDDTPAPAPAAAPSRRRADFWGALRVVVMVVGLLSLAAWGYYSWRPPTQYVFAVGAPVFAAVVWFLFRSPRSPIRTDTVGKVIVETALVVAAGAAWVSIGYPLVGLVFVVVAALTGVVAFRRETPA
ncbi:YrdB family protein [Curtobacterium sp. RRHDQ10]|uniref:YrdB family protein n=1 Tax=Curtobacterium phyllosphaerae TaxID=3413379 RepID=UPI003BF0A53B